MKMWKEEVFCDYQRYRFGYAAYAEFEPGDTLSEIYCKGFLPMSHNNQVQKQFYEARGLRIPLKDFALTSENRRVLKLHNQLLQRTVVVATEFDFQDQVFLRFCETYLTEVLHLDGHKKLASVLKTDLITDVVIYSSDGDTVGYVFLVQDEKVAHYWFSFYTPEKIKQSFGIYMMLQEIQTAQKLGREHLYLGTCYGTKGAYKTNFKPYEYWNGTTWTQNEKHLKNLLKQESYS